MSDLPEFPEGQAPAAPEPATPDYGADPETIQNALNMYRGLNNLDTRGEYLQRIVRPEYDGQFLRQMVEPQQQPADPWGHVEQGYEEQYEEPAYQEQGLDPRDLRQTLDPVFQGYGEQVEQRIFERLGQMAHEQAIKESAQSAAQQAGLPARFASAIEYEVQQAARMQPNRQPAELAAEIATAYRTELAQIAATPPAQAPPAGRLPGGPAPDSLQRPNTGDALKDALEWSKQALG